MKFKNKKIQETYKEIEKEKGSEASELKKKYLGKNGLVTKLLRGIGEVAQEDRKQYGSEVNALKSYVEQLIAGSSKSQNSEAKSRIDPTAPFDINSKEEERPQKLNRKGTIHPIITEMNNVLEIFRTMGFDVLESRQLDDDYHMFESLNIPKGHPARDIWDSFWTDEGLIPPAHTSTMQNRAMKKFGPPPIRVVIPGRCFRNEATDASHEHTFYQVEGIYVDRNISMGNMLGTIKTYLEAFFETELEIRVQPAYFPFTEPDSEIVMSCPFCHKTGCNVCGQSGWMEIMGCGMIHPNVLTEAGIDPKEYSGFAWGFGLDRMVMIKNAIKDIRRLHSGDLNFLEQF